MGLDIMLFVEDQSTLFPSDYDDIDSKYWDKHSLSRTFCNFICRKNFSPDVVPELDQIGRMTSIDISPIYEMESYSAVDDENIRFQLEVAESEEEKKQILAQAKESRDKLRGNIDKVLSTVNALIDRLSRIDDLHEVLNDHGHDTLNYKQFFTDFNATKKEHFGTDLRNFKSFLEYAKDKGATTVFFLYG